jgi:hypothetical protein
MLHAWEQPQAPTAAALADWIETQPWDLDQLWLSKIIERLRCWPVGQSFPLIPDDDALETGVRADPRWWTPGAAPGGVRLPSRRLRIFRDLPATE